MQHSTPFTMILSLFVLRHECNVIIGHFYSEEHLFAAHTKRYCDDSRGARGCADLPAGDATVSSGQLSGPISLTVLAFFARGSISGHEISNSNGLGWITVRGAKLRARRCSMHSKSER